MVRIISEPDPQSRDAAGRQHHLAAYVCHGFDTAERSCDCRATGVLTCLGCGEALIAWPLVYGGCEHLVALRDSDLWPSPE